ncbi:hypothetical protein [Gordonia aichiensis]|uniref:Uncharacterized protein n=1 Tax=Gordonia aichiensis NBRC 108223 TaxID=1220583 RepID=L7KQ29_9ACTN|nr:hypothetical protein [Gordonia aichiensis]GAC50734.1 hypothetical protein GOACH_29_00220 [Gordonia aichiensis NBRC 108223]
MTAMLNRPTTTSTGDFFVTVLTTTPSVASDLATITELPVLIDCATLSTAQRQARRMSRQTDDGHTVVPVIKVEAAGSQAARTQTCVTVMPSARSIVSFAIDMRLLDIAHGIVVVAPACDDPIALRDDIIAALNAAGCPTRTRIPGWCIAPAS